MGISTNSALNPSNRRLNSITGVTQLNFDKNYWFFWFGLIRHSFLVNCFAFIYFQGYTKYLSPFSSDLVGFFISNS